MPWQKFRSECEKLAGELHDAKASVSLEIPPKEVDADLAFPCFSLAKQQKRNPFEIAKELEVKLAAKIKGRGLIREVKAAGPYVNFYINYNKFSPAVISEILRKKAKYGSDKKKKEMVLVEFPGPNTNKPLHLGHLRNMVLGTSVSNILQFLGSDVKNVDIINDRGVHICKSMLAYKEFGHEVEPDKKPDHFVGDFYVLFAKKLNGQEGVEQKLHQMLADWENGDKGVRALWKKMNSWAIDGFKTTYRRFGVRIDKPYYESEHYMDGKKIVTAGLKKHIFTKDEKDNIIIDLGEHGLGKRVLLRPDGTSLYLTQDLGLAVKRYQDFHMDKMIYVVGEEQKDHFRALFKIFEILGYSFAGNCHHLSYGMVNLPEGRMKSREGTVVDADDLMDELHAMAEKKLRERISQEKDGAGMNRAAGISEKQLRERAEKIGIGAIKYFLVKFDPAQPITYDPKASLEFEGDTGPYLQYTYARANSIIKKSKKKADPKPVFTEKIELELVKKLSQFSAAVEKSADEYKPNILASYLFELATIFNEFYHALRVVGDKAEGRRLALVQATMHVLGSSLQLLGMDALKEM